MEEGIKVVSFKWVPLRPDEATGNERRRCLDIVLAAMKHQKSARAFTQARALLAVARRIKGG